MNGSQQEDDYEDAFEESEDDAQRQQEAGSKRSTKARPASNRGRPTQPQTSQIQGAAAVGVAAGQPNGRINTQLQNELVDKEVEQVIMKSSNQGNAKKVAGYALPDDDEDDDGQPFHPDVDGDEDEEEQDDEGGQMDDEDDQQQMDDEEEDEEQMDDGGLQGGGQQIVNITSSDNGAQQQKQQRQNSAAPHQQNNDAILVINNQNDQNTNQRPQTHQVPHRQGQSQRAFEQAQSQAGAQYGQPPYDIQQQNFMMQDQSQQQDSFGQPMPPQAFGGMGPQQQMYQRNGMLRQQQMVGGIRPMRRNVMANMMNQGPPQQPVPPGGFSILNGVPQQLDQMKRKKLREMIFGAKQHPQAQSFNYFMKMQKEDLQNHYRNLKITNNVTKDENTRLKTKLQQIQYELNQRDKELEKLTLRLQQQMTQPTGAADGMALSTKSSGSKNHHFAESFIISQLKKNNRDLKLEVQEKDRLIEQLKRNIKLSKTQEIEVELTVYIDECLRLRQQLEQTLMEKNMILQQQQEMGVNPGGVNQQMGGQPRNMDDLANLEEAFRYQSMELQRERENQNNLQMQLLKLQEQKGKMKEKQDANKKKIRRINELVSSNKRQQNIIDVKNKESISLRQDMEELRQKLMERERVHAQNRDLVTKNCSQQSQIEQLKRRVNDLNGKLESMQNEKMKIEIQQKQRNAQEYVPRVYKLAQQKQQREAKSPVRSGYSVAQGSASVQMHVANISSQSQHNLEVSARYEPPQPEPKKEEELEKVPSAADDLPNMVEKVTEKAPSPELVIPPSAPPEEKTEPKVEESEKPEVKLQEESVSNKQAASKKSLDQLEQVQAHQAQQQKDLERQQQELEQQSRDMQAQKQSLEQRQSQQQQEPVEAPRREPSESAKREASKKDNDDQVLHESKAEEPEMYDQEEMPDDKRPMQKAPGQDEGDDVYHIEKTQDEIQEQGYLQNFFECPYEYQQVIFMMVKGDQEALSENQLYLESQELFNYYLQCIIEFSQQFDPTDTLMQIAGDDQKREWIHSAPEEPVNLQYILKDLWPKLGFLPIDPENPGVALVAEFMLNELILKNSESLEELNLTHLKELFSGEDEEGLEGLEDDMEDMQQMMGYGQLDSNEAMEAMEALQRRQQKEQDEYEDDDYSDPDSPDTKDKSKVRPDDEPLKQSPNPVEKQKSPTGDDYSSDKSSEDDNRFMDINDLKERQQQAANESPGKSSKISKSKAAAAAADDENYDDDDFI